MDIYIPLTQKFSWPEKHSEGFWVQMKEGVRMSIVGERDVRNKPARRHLENGDRLGQVGEECEQPVVALASCSASGTWAWNRHRGLQGALGQEERRVGGLHGHPG